MAKINAIDITSLTFQEGSAPSTPASTKWKLYTKTDGLYYIDDAGVETGPLAAASATFVGAKAYNSSTQSLTASTADQIVTFDSEEYDTDTIHSVASNTGRFTVPAGKGGTWMFHAGSLLQNGTQNYLVYFRLNGTTPIRGGVTVGAGSGGSYRFQVSCAASLSAGDYVELLVTTGTGSSQTIGHASTVNAQTWMTAHFAG